MNTRLLPRLVLTAALLLPAVPASALNLQQTLERLGSEVLQPSSSLDEITAYLLPSPLASGTIAPVSGTAPVVNVAAISGNPQWFALVDLFPCQLFQHPVKYVFIDDVTGVVTIFDAEDWPALDGDQIVDVPGASFVRIYPIVPQPQPADPPVNLNAPVADYGDAPDGGLAYPGVLGRFPTLHATANTVSGLPGGHVTTVGVETLGQTASAERDAGDPADPDGRPNLIDDDADERMFLALNPNTSPGTAYLIVDVAVAVGGPDVPRYVNVLIDFNRSGAWSGAGAENEWAVINAVVNVAPGTVETIVTPGFTWGTVTEQPEETWMRVALTRDSIVPGSFGVTGWSGLGALGAGEIEDALVDLKPCGGGGGGGGDDDGPEETPPPGELIGWNLVPIKFHALVVQGIDHPGQNAAAQAAGTMSRTLQVQGYNTSSLSGAEATKDDIADWINNLLPGLTCQDKVLIYFIAHGAKNTPGGSMRLRAKTKSDPGTLTGADLADLLALIPTCAGDDCDFPSASCGVTVVIESCYSGQFLDAVGGSGQEVFTASTGQEPSWFGADGSGGEYSDQYAECADVANRATTDANQDGIVTPAEIHNCAANNLGRPQMPLSAGGSCDCECPWIWWECLEDPDSLVRFFPGDIGASGSPLGQSFADAPEGIVLLPGQRRYDFLKLELEPTEWIWVAEVPSEGPPIPIEVHVMGASVENPVRVQLFTLALPPSMFPPLPLRLFVNLPANQFMIQTAQGQQMAQGPWNTYPQNLDSQTFIPLPAARATVPPVQPVQVEIVPLSLTSAAPLLIRWSPQPEVQYFLERKIDLSQRTWETIAGPLDNTGRVVVPETDQAYYQIRSQPAVPSGIAR